ncbi:transcription antiterminator BglG, partial [Tetragenococcus halophilus]
MNKRMEKIYQYIAQKNNSGTKSEPTAVTTSEIAQALAIQRSNASKDLNQLVRDEKITKTDSRPVKYFLNQDMSEEKYVKSYKQEREPRKKQQPQHVQSSFVSREDIFSNIIGINGSMKNAGEQAKAAILYPPRGLNC